MLENQAEITQLLVRWKDGDTAAEAELTPVLYRELHSLAQRYLRNERTAHTLQPTRSTWTLSPTNCPIGRAGRTSTA